MVSKKLDFLQAHPSQMINRKAKIVIHSRANRPRAKPYIKKYFRPPRLLKSSWYFQKDLSNTGLLKLTASATNLADVWLSPEAKSTQISFYVLNPILYKTPFAPGIVSNRPLNVFQDSTGETELMTYPETTTSKKPITAICLWDPEKECSNQWWNALYPQNITSAQLLINALNSSGSQVRAAFPALDKLLHDPFSPQVLKAKITTKPINWGNWSDWKNNNPNGNNDFNTGSNPGKILKGTWRPTNDQIFHMTWLVRYSPENDDGSVSGVFFKAVTSTTPYYEAPSTTNHSTTGYPLWLCPFGLADHIEKSEPKIQLGLNYMLVIKSQSIQPAYRPKANSQSTYYIPIDTDFRDGIQSYNPQPSSYDIQHWYPRWDFQKLVTCDISRCGPFSVRLPPGKFSWSLTIKYQFFFKWGGNLEPQVEVCDPATRATFTFPGDIGRTISVSDPARIRASRMLHDFDTRRDFLTAHAAARLKRAISDSEWEETEESPIKKRRVTKSVSLKPATDPLDQALENIQNIPYWYPLKEPSTAKETKELFQQQGLFMDLYSRELQRVIKHLARRRDTLNTISNLGR